MPNHRNASLPPSVRALSNPSWRRAASTRAGALALLAAVGLYGQASGAAAPTGPLPPTLDAALIKQLASPAQQPAAPATAASRPPAAAADRAPKSVPSATRDRPAWVSKTPKAAPPRTAAVVTEPSAPPRADPAGRSYAGQPEPLDVATIRALAVPASPPAAATTKPAAAQSAPAQPVVQPPPLAPKIAMTPVTGLPATTGRPPATRTVGGDAAAVVRPAKPRTAGLPAALDATVISALAGEPATPVAPTNIAPAPAELPPAQMDMLRDVFAPEMRR